jgi:predicted aspartyl protease
MVTAVVDSGADGTLLPIDVLEAVGAAYVGEGVIRGISGTGQRVSMYLTSLHVGSRALHAMRVVAVPEGSEAILGRNALQFLVVTLNGPAATTEIGA